MKRKLRVWQLQTAKNQFSEVVDRARTEGPQVVTRHGRKTAVVLAMDDFLAMTGESKPTRTFTELLLSAPKVRGGLSIERDADTGRKVKLG